MVNIQKTNRGILPRKEWRRINDPGLASLSAKSKPASVRGRGGSPTSAHVLTVGCRPHFLHFWPEADSHFGHPSGFPNLFPTGVHIPFYTLHWGPYSYYISSFKAYAVSILVNTMRSVSSGTCLRY